MGARSQRKGRAAELELSRILQDHGYPVEAGRAQSYGDVPDLSGLPGVHIECKRTETLRLSEWMAQAERDAQRFGDGVPAVFFRRSREPWRVVMKLEDWMALYGADEKTAPLTLEELREMGGEPVWVVIAGMGRYAVIEHCWERATKFTDGMEPPNDRYGTYWRAYRRRPEEAAPSGETGGAGRPYPTTRRAKAR